MSTTTPAASGRRSSPDGSTSSSSERVRVEKARLRIVLDRRLGGETPALVKELAKKKV